MRNRTIPTIIALAALLSLPGAAVAHGDEQHDHAAAAGGAVMPPAVAGDPAPGAQPAAPAAAPAAEADVTAPAAAASTTAAVGEVSTSTPKPAAARVASGGGSHEGHDTATPQPAETIATGGGDAGATTPAAPAATPTGELPFTGVEDNILLISLAGMLVPIGVLLWCAARRGDLARLRRHLAGPRYQWSEF